jgi:hypothetical protein
MKNSRREGLLYFETKKTFKVSIDGGFEERNSVICHDVNSKCEGAALDIEQLLISAMSSLKGNSNPDPEAVEKNQKEGEVFFNNESPAHKDVEEQAKGLEFSFMMNTEVKISVIIKAFKEMILAGVISTTGDILMTASVWDKINIKDKSYICFMYCAFFANPLERL